MQWMFSGFWCASWLAAVCLWLGRWHFWEDFLIRGSLGASEVTGILCALSAFVDKAKLVKLELEFFKNFFFFNLRKQCTSITSGSSQAQSLTAITGKWWNKLFGNLFIISVSFLFIPSKWGKETLTCIQEVDLPTTTVLVFFGFFFPLFFSCITLFHTKFHTCCYSLNKTLLVYLYP